MLDGKIILLTGGTGSFGQKFCEIALKRFNPKVIRIYSRDELKQWDMQKKFCDHEKLRFLLGDIRDKERLDRSMDGVDIVVHAAALKQVPSCEYNPFEAVKTNIIGAQNIIDSAIDHNIEKVIAISTDKAVSPANLYGATKLCMEKLFVAANAYVGPERKTKMSNVRYGNVIGSRGSIIPLFCEQRESERITITDARMTRFWITLEQGVEFVIRCIEMMRGGEIFIPKIPSMKITDIADFLAPDCKVETIGIRPGEKLHECLLTKDEARHSLDFDNFFLIQPQHPWWRYEAWEKGKELPEFFEYTSDMNASWVTQEMLKTMIEEI